MSVEELITACRFVEVDEAFVAGVAMATFSCDKPLRRYPGILIGRLGVNKDLSGQGYGTAIMEYIKLWLMDSVPVGFRFLIVDAHNNPNTLHYYEMNQFYYVFSTEQQEIESSGIESCPTRLMIYDFKE